MRKLCSALKINRVQSLNGRRRERGIYSYKINRCLIQSDVVIWDTIWISIHIIRRIHAPTLNCRSKSITSGKADGVNRCDFKVQIGKPLRKTNPSAK